MCSIYAFRVEPVYNKKSFQMIILWSNQLSATNRVNFDGSILNKVANRYVIWNLLVFLLEDVNAKCSLPTLFAFGKSSCNVWPEFNQVEFGGYIISVGFSFDNFKTLKNK